MFAPGLGMMRFVKWAGKIFTSAWPGGLGQPLCWCDVAY